MSVKVVGCLRVDVSMRFGIDWMKIGKRGHTVASQHTRTSYRCPGLRFSRKNHDSVPSGAKAVGNEALSWVRTIGSSGESRSTPRSSMSGPLDGIVVEGGAMKMAFSTFAVARVVNSARSVKMDLYMSPAG